MKIGDFVISKTTAFGQHVGIVKIVAITPTYYIMQINFPSAEENKSWNAYCARDLQAPSSLQCLAIDKAPLLEGSVQDFARELSRWPEIRPSEKANFAEFLKRKLIEEFGEPPAKVVEAEQEIPELVLENDLPIKPRVVEGQVSGFIRINNQ